MPTSSNSLTSGPQLSISFWRVAVCSSTLHWVLFNRCEGPNYNFSSICNPVMSAKMGTRIDGPFVALDEAHWNAVIYPARFRLTSNIMRNEEPEWVSGPVDFQVVVEGSCPQGPGLLRDFVKTITAKLKSSGANSYESDYAFHKRVWNGLIPAGPDNNYDHVDDSEAVQHMFPGFRCCSRTIRPEPGWLNCHQRSSEIVSAWRINDV